MNTQKSHVGGGVLQVVAVVESEDHVCCRYRIHAFRAVLEAAGHRLSVRALPRGLFRRCRVLRAVRRADVVVLQRQLLPWFEFRLLRRNARRLVFDFDDAVWLRDSYSVKGFDSPKRRRRFLRTVAACDAVVAGNGYLARATGARVSATAGVTAPVPLPPFGGDGRRVAIIPTCVDPLRYPLADHRRIGAGVKLVWLGSSSTLQGLELQRDLMNRLGQAVPGIRLKVVCDRFPTFAHLPVEAVPWREDTEAAELAEADIGIGWVPDDPWSRGKCGLKLLQYQAAGLPVVANPVGVQREMVRVYQTGFPATTADEWVNAVRLLASDPGLRMHLGRAGRHQTETAYSVAAGGAAWVKLLESL